MIDCKTKFVFVHLGKTGGSSVISMLKKHKFNFEIVHIQQVKFDPLKKYVLLIRNPIKRFVSAFNWRYFLLVDDICKKNWSFSTKPATRNEILLLKKYKTPNNLAENIANFDYEKDYIHHINENYEFYFQEFFLSHSQFSFQNIFVMNTESLQEDFQKLFGINEQLSREKNNPNYNCVLSLKAVENLNMFLHKDIEIYQKLSLC